MPAGGHTNKYCSPKEMASHSQQYREVLKSKRWKEFSRYAVHQAQNECQRCGMPKKPLHTHHLHYETLGNEKLTDVEVVCRDCHPEADEERAKASAIRADDRQFHNGYETYMRKKYGEGFEDDYASRQEFYEWRQSQR